MRDLSDYALVRTTNNVLRGMLGSTSALTAQVDGSGVKVAMDRYFTFTALFSCLMKHNVFCVGTAQKNRRGMRGAEHAFKTRGSRLKVKGDMNFVRSGELAAVQWKESRLANILSTIHVYDRDFRGVLHE